MGYCIVLVKACRVQTQFKRRANKLDNRMAATRATFDAYNNICRVHQTLRVTPAMEARLTDHVWSLEELVGLLDRRSAEAA
jgi:hypothetical protein